MKDYYKKPELIICPVCDYQYPKNLNHFKKSIKELEKAKIENSIEYDYALHYFLKSCVLAYEYQEQFIITKSIACHSCGWSYDENQEKDHDLPNQSNRLSLNDYKKWYKKQILKNPTFYMSNNYELSHNHKCPVCKKTSFEIYDSLEECRYCGWTDDFLMTVEPDDWAGATNCLCLNDYKIVYKLMKSQNPKYKWSKDYKKWYEFVDKTCVYQIPSIQEYFSKKQKAS